MSPPLAKFFAGVIASPKVSQKKIVEALERVFGPVDYISPVFPFEMTGYYEKEMGAGLFRFFLSFSPLKNPEELVLWKEKASCEENKWCKDGKRQVNIDPGYMDTYKIVLASYKEGGQKLYLGRSVWGDMILQYRKGAWVSFPWTFPDFAGGFYEQALNEIRNRLKEENKLQHKC